MISRPAPAILVFLLYAACDSGGAGNSNSVSAGMEQMQQDTDDQIAHIDPCGLITKEEILAQIDLSFDPDQLAGRREKGITYELATERKESPWQICTVTWRSVDPSGQNTGGSGREFQIHVMTADQLKMFENLDRRATIEGVGDEAFYVENAPYTRVGNVAIGIAEFPDTHGHGGKGAIELLRAAIQRLPRS